MRFPYCRRHRLNATLLPNLLVQPAPYLPHELGQSVDLERAWDHRYDSCGGSDVRGTALSTHRNTPKLLSSTKVPVLKSIARNLPQSHARGNGNAPRYREIRLPWGTLQAVTLVICEIKKLAAI